MRSRDSKRYDHPFMTARLHRTPVEQHHAPGRREWVLASDIHAITPIVESVQSLCLAAGYSARHCQLNIPVSITEALANAIIRGNHEKPDATVRIVVWLDETALCVEVTDEGNGFDTTAVMYSPTDEDWLQREDGRGLFIMRSLMDTVESQCDACGGHTLRLTLQRT